SYGEREGLTYGEYYCLILFATMGMILMAGGNNLLTIFLGVEVISISLYVLAGFLKTRARSNEAAVKYFLLGAFATGFLLYGIALIYGATGTTDLTRISAFALKGAAQGNILLLAGMALLIVGLGFKLAAVPFHMWTPDVYEGAPTSVTAFMSAGPKAAVFAAFFRIFAAALPQLKPDWTALLWVIAVLTMTLGNVVALAQFNIKRMLAYSSIAHAGYLLIAVVVGDRLASSGLLFYLLAYTLMNLGAFGVVAALETREGGALDLRDYRGLGYKYPGLAFAMGVFMFSLSGIPPTAGFVGKFYIFSAAVNSGFIWLAVIGVLNSVVSVYFYLRVVVYMYMLEPTRELAAPPLSIYTVIALILTVLGTLGLGVFPSLFMELAQRSIIAFT
ncbi:MAG: NADH-quinone oxidoreductase subunit N, partial [Nitrospinota bacterium]